MTVVAVGAADGLAAVCVLPGTTGRAAADSGAESL